MKRKNILEFLKVILVIAAVFGFVVLAGCTSAPRQTQVTSTLPALTQVGTPDPSSSLPTNFIAAVQKVMPSVVKIEVTYGPQGAPDNPQAQAGAGTGWVVRGGGLIVTNNHVVDGAQTVTVLLADGTKLSPQSIQTDSTKDLAVLKIAGQNLSALPTGDSAQLQPGQPVAAVGNALNLGIRVTVGVVSQLNVPVSYAGISLNGLIETDASINPGNSGGILINMLGEVVGIPNAGLKAPNLDVENFGYAISINEALPVVNKLIAQMP